MNIKQLKCESCMAKLNPEDAIRGVVCCSYCGTYSFIDDESYHKYLNLTEKQRDNTFSSWVGSSASVFKTDIGI